MSANDKMAGQPAGLVTIERAVAFVVGPVVIAGSAWLSAWLASRLGVEVSSGEITAVAATGGIGAAGLIYKWLDGRSKHTVATLQLDAQAASSALATAGLPVKDQQGIVHMAEEDLKKLVEGAANQAVDAFHKATPAGDPAEPIIASPHDPAPATPIEPPAPIDPAAPVLDPQTAEQPPADTSL